jgi:hypothetical protein
MWTRLNTSLNCFRRTPDILDSPIEANASSGVRTPTNATGTGEDSAAQPNTGSWWRKKLFPQRTNDSGAGGQKTSSSDKTAGNHTSVAATLETVETKAGTAVQEETAPYFHVSVRTRRYPNCGTLKPGAVAATDFARQAAELLIGPDGKLDTRAVDDLIVDAKADTALPVHYRTHVIQRLTDLKRDHELAAIINSICESTVPQGPALDIVKRTVKHEPGFQYDSRTELQADARKAVLTALLSDLRQSDVVGTCFVIAPAICLHGDVPRQVARDMQELLEKQSITYDDKIPVTVPLNQHVSWADAEIPLRVDADGMCRGLAAWKDRSDLYSLHHTPGMRTALTALGIPDKEMKEAVHKALAQLGLNQGGTVVSNRQIIECIVRETSAPEEADKKIADALNAFAAEDRPALTTAWLYTLATRSEMNSQQSYVHDLTEELVFGDSIPGMPHLKSFREKNDLLQECLASDTCPAKDIGARLLDNIAGQMQSHLCRQFDPSIGEKDLSGADGPPQGGWVMHERMRGDGPLTWRRTDNAELFQQAMARAVQEAARMTEEQISALCPAPFDATAGRQALQAMTENLLNEIGSASFPTMVAMKMDSRSGETAPSEPNRSPWSANEGGVTKPIIRSYGGNPDRYQITLSHPPGVDKNSTGDATELAKFLCEGLAGMRPELVEKLNTSHATFRLPILSGRHTFSLFPCSMDEIWLTANMGPQEWIDHGLKTSAQKYLNESRTEPPLYELLNLMRDALGASKDDINTLYGKICRGGIDREGRVSYQLNRVHEVITDYCEASWAEGEKLAAAQAILMENVPPPVRIVGDLNWSNDDGEGLCLGLCYNPFEKRVEACEITLDGHDRAPTNARSLDGLWQMSLPLKAKPV